MIHDDCYKVEVIQNGKTIRNYRVSNTTRDSEYVNRLKNALQYKHPDSEVKVTSVRYSDLSYEERIALQSDYI